MIKITEYLDYLLEDGYHELSNDVIFAPLQISNLNNIHNKTLIRWHGKNLVKVGYPVSKDIDRWLDIESNEEYDLSALSVYTGLEVIYGDLYSIISFLDGELNNMLNLYVDDKNNFIKTGTGRAVFENSYNKFLDLKISTFNLRMLYDKISTLINVERDMEVERDKRLAKESNEIEERPDQMPVCEEAQPQSKEYEDCGGESVAP